jgi:hypothetical protein
MFPRLIHQTWKTEDLSGIREFDLCSESWKRHHPGYEYRFWTDRDNQAFVESEFGSYHDTWSSFDKNIKRLDALRYMWMHEYGGIYADLDMECLQSLDPLLERHRGREIILFCDLSPRGRVISANSALLISRPGSEFWLRILDYARDHRRRYVTRCTGPFALGTVARRYAKEFDIVLLNQNELLIRKWKKRFYSRVPGNEDDHRIYKDVYCSTDKPAKYYEDKETKYVADWHGTPWEYRWHREYWWKLARRRRPAGLPDTTT